MTAVMSAAHAHVLVCFIVCISVPGNQVHGNAKSICALKGSTVDLPCTEVENTTTGMKWNTVYMKDDKEVLTEISADGYTLINGITKENNFTLTLNNLRETDAKSYCCTEKAGNQESCWLYRTELRVADLQVKVIPATQDAMTLMCSTSCHLTETPIVYIWYRNREFLYEDWSPWYQELVGSDEGVAYSCAIKGYEDLRAPEVSVDSITSTCFKVTYAEGRMCSYQHMSTTKSCSITYPREIKIGKILKNDSQILVCNSPCILPSDPPLAYRWRWNNELIDGCESKGMLDMISSSHYSDSVSCAIKGHEDLRSDEVCTSGTNQNSCWRVKYASRRICALEGSSVDILSSSSAPRYALRNLEQWYKISGRGEITEFVTRDVGWVEIIKAGQNQQTLRIMDVRQNDSAEYTFSNSYQGHRPGVLLFVTGLRVTMTPSAVATEGQRVMLTCTTSCPLADGVSYIWYMNGRRLTLEEPHDKHLLLAPVVLDNTGNYSCVVMSTQNLTSAEEKLTVLAREKSVLIMNAVKVTVLLLLMLNVPVALYCSARKKKRPRFTIKLKDNGQNTQMESLYEGIALRPMTPASRAEQQQQRQQEDGL